MLDVGISLSEASAVPVTVQFTTADGTATAGSDYQATTGSIAFDSGITDAAIAVTILSDAIDEDDETFFINLSNPANVIVPDPQSHVTIEDDDGVGPALHTLTINDVTVTEGNSGMSAATFSVMLSVAAVSSVTVQYATANGTATSGSDFTATTGTLTIPAGQLTGTIQVPVNGDIAQEPDETFVVNLSNPTGATLADAQGQGTITNDDMAPPARMLEFDRRNKAVFTDADGDAVTVSLGGPGSGEVLLSTEGQVDATAIALAASTDRSSLTVAVKKKLGAGRTTAGDIGVTGSLAGLSIDAGVTDVGGGRNALTAQSIKSIKVNNQMRHVDVDLAAPLAPKAMGIGSLSVTGRMLDVAVRAVGSLGKFTVGTLANSTLFAGVSAQVVGLPTGLADLAATGASISNVTIKGLKGVSGNSFVRSSIAAGTLTAVSAKLIDTHNDGTPFDLAGDIVRSCSATGRDTLKNLTEPSQSYAEDDFVVRVL